MSPGRSFAIIPAAGQSLRMGVPKLVLPWNGSTIIGHVLNAWTNSQITRILVTIRDDDERLLAECSKFDVDIVRSRTPPADMKQSVQIAVEHAERTYAAATPDRWLVFPADLPRISVAIINSIIERGRMDDAILSPRFGDRGGHPVSFPWWLRDRLFQLQPHQGVNRILDFHRRRHVHCPSDREFDDVDTPADYQKLTQDSNSNRAH